MPRISRSRPRTACWRLDRWRSRPAGARTRRRTPLRPKTARHRGTEFTQGDKHSDAWYNVMYEHPHQDVIKPVDTPSPWLSPNGIPDLHISRARPPTTSSARIQMRRQLRGFLPPSAVYTRAHQQAQRDRRQARAFRTNGVLQLHERSTSILHTDLASKTRRRPCDRSIRSVDLARCDWVERRDRRLRVSVGLAPGNRRSAVHNADE